MIPQQPCHHINCKKTYLKLYITNDNNGINLTNNIKVAKFKILVCLFLNSFSEGDTSFSTLFQQFHKALTKYYSDGGQSLYDPSNMERFCEEHARRMFEDIYDAIFNDEKQSPSEKKRNLQKSRVVAGSLL